MGAVNRMAQARIARSRRILGPALAVHWVEFIGLADIMAERSCEHDVAINLDLGMRGGKFLDHPHRKMRNTTQMNGLVASAPSHSGLPSPGISLIRLNDDPASENAQPSITLPRSSASLMSLISGKSSTIVARSASVMGRRWMGGVPRMLTPEVFDGLGMVSVCESGSIHTAGCAFLRCPHQGYLPRSGPAALA